MNEPIPQDNINDSKPKLHEAALNGNPEVVRYLLNQPPQDGSKPMNLENLHLAAEGGKIYDPLANSKMVDHDKSSVLGNLQSMRQDALRPENDLAASKPNKIK